MKIIKRFIDLVQGYSEFKVGGIGGSSRVVILVTRITHKLESPVRGCMTDEVRTFIKASIAIFTQTELVFTALHVALY
jgi:hypothetical protein